MELKYKGKELGAIIDGCFNRTFMELKYVEAGLIPAKLRFQSYLYGIEIRISKFEITWFKGVSIVPLWN